VKKITAILLSLCLALPYSAFAQQSISTGDETEFVYRRFQDLPRFYTQDAAAPSTSFNSAATGILSSVNDTYYDSSGSWGQNYDDMWGLKRINAENAWKLSTGEGVTIAVLDSGIGNHSEISPQLWTNAEEAGGSPGIDDDNNGYVDDFWGWDFHNDLDFPHDGYGHGTHVAGIIGAKGNNNKGIIGVAYDSKIMPLKILGDGRISYPDRIAAGIRYAADMDAKILSCSFAAPYNNDVISAFRYAFDKGCIIIASAGNDDDIINEYPAMLDYTVAVGSIGEDNTRSSWSNYGIDLDVVAPGEDILSLRAPGTNITGSSSDFVPPGNFDAEYLRLSGTSMSTPYVSGLAALMLSQSPTLTYEDFVRRLKFSSDDLGTAGWDQYYGWGRLDAFEALSHDWYDSGIERTWWRTNPDASNIIRYDYFESGTVQSKWFESPNLENAIRYSFFESGRLDSKWLHSPDRYGNTRYSYYDEDFDNNTERFYIKEAADGSLDCSYGFKHGTITNLVEYRSDLFPTLGEGKFLLYYDSDILNVVSTKFEFDSGGIGEANILSEDEVQITKFNYNSTTGNTAWFLWGRDVYGWHDNVVIEQTDDISTEINVDDNPTRMVIDPDGGDYVYVTNYDSNSVNVISTSNNSIERTIGVGNGPGHIAITPNGNSVYVANHDSDTISVINTSNNSIRRTIRVGDRPGHIAIIPNRYRAYVNHFYTGTVSVIDTWSNSVERTISVKDFPLYTAITPDGNYAYVIHSYSNTVSVINTSNNSIEATVNVGYNPSDIAMVTTPDKKNYAYVVNNSYYGTVSVIDTSNNSIERTISVGRSPVAVAIAPDGNRAYVVNYESGTVSVVNTSDNSLEATVRVGTRPVKIAIAPDGNYAYVTNSCSDSVSVIDTSDNSLERTISVGDLPGSIAITPNGNYAYVINKRSNSVSKIYTRGCAWSMYTFLPDTKNLENVINPDNWNFIGEVSDPESIQHILPELGNWWDWIIENNVVPEFPPLSSDRIYDGLDRVIERIDRNPKTDTTYIYEWDYQGVGRVKEDMSYDYDDDGNIDLISTRIYTNDIDYNIENINTWEILSESSKYYKNGILNKYVTLLLSGDFNLDGRVDLSDFAIIVGNFGRTEGATRLTGDTNRDEKVDGEDLNDFASQFGNRNLLREADTLLTDTNGNSVVKIFASGNHREIHIYTDGLFTEEDVLVSGILKQGDVIIDNTAPEAPENSAENIEEPVVNAATIPGDQEVLARLAIAEELTASRNTSKLTYYNELKSKSKYLDWLKN